VKLTAVDASSNKRRDRGGGRGRRGGAAMTHLPCLVGVLLSLLRTILRASSSMAVPTEAATSSPVSVGTRPFSAVWTLGNSSFSCPVATAVDLPSFGLRGRWGADNEHSSQYWLFTVSDGLWPVLPGDGPAWTHGRALNGGVPAAANATLHLARVAEVVGALPAQWAGLGVWDFETWYPLWEMNDQPRSARLGKPRTRYQNASRALVRARHPSWSEVRVEEAAASEWNAAARALWVGTLQLSRRMRPRARWGFYNYPAGAVDASERRWNAALGWLWEESTALYPSLYSGVVQGGPAYAEAVQNITAESVQLAGGGGSHSESPTTATEVWPFVWYKLCTGQPYAHWMTAADMNSSVAVPSHLGADGVIVYGSSSSDARNASECQMLQAYVNKTLGPIVLAAENEQARPATGSTATPSWEMKVPPHLADRQIADPPQRNFAWWYHADGKGTNVSEALALLASAGGAEVASSFLVYCNDTVDPRSGRFVFGTTPACALRSPGPAGPVLLAPALRAMGVRMERCLGHVDDAQTLRRFLAFGDENLADLVALVRAHGLAGYSFDIEAQGTRANDTAAYVAWLSRARSELHRLGARVTAYGYSAHHSATSSSLGALSTAVDRLFDGDTYNYRDRGPTNYSGWLSEYTKLVGRSNRSNVSLSKAAPAMMLSTERGAWNCNASAIALRLRRAMVDGVQEVGGFNFEPSARCEWSAHYSLELCHCTRAWLPAVRSWLRQDR
jgi:hyaluronoglucosaminidase